MRPEVSVVMANYNGERYLAAAIESLRAQSLPSWELLFVDDASDDRSIAEAFAAAEGDSRIRILRQPFNRGPAAARNRALAETQGRWVAVLDSDDLMKRDRLRTLIDRAEQDKAEIVADNMLMFSEEGCAAAIYLPASFAGKPRWIDLAGYIDGNRLYSRVPDLGYLKPLISANLLRRTGIRYDERLRIGEDYDLIARLLAAGARMRIEPSANYFYRRHPHSTSWRMQVSDIEALIAADMRFACEVRPLVPEERRALSRRTASLRTILLYERAVDMIKAGSYGDAALICLSAPRIWPLLTRPVRVRLKRLVEQTRLPQSPAPA
ncbi:MAG: glycosyltransferase family 2 protein [Alphaproteobacteria bacterium]|nr:glycosyltransferase family 2 protein [Alphaproteobacteria bacterium]MBV9693893.1 glycosyltransferase family 2 protein [Alphaproteobacteria bacterium]